MGIGYIFGCLISIFLWRINRQGIFLKLDRKFARFIPSIVLRDEIYLLATIILALMFFMIGRGEIFNFVTAFAVIDVSNTERESVEMEGITPSHRQLISLSEALICGFIAPLAAIMLFGNWAGIFYVGISFIRELHPRRAVLFIYNVLNIVPCMVLNIVLYIIYMLKQKTLYADFQGDFLKNLFIDPLLNIYIISSQLEGVNLYHYFLKNDRCYIKKYGTYTDECSVEALKNYLSIVYAICLIYFVAFYAILFL